MMTDNYCPRNEIKKLEMEIWDMKVKGTDLTSYTQRFQELALLCGRMFPEESDKIEKYIGGLPDMIYGSVVASKPKIMQEAVAIATELMDRKIHTFVERQTENKRKQDDNNNQALQQPLKKQGVAIAYTAGPGERKEYAGTLPLSNKCKFHHNGQCTVKCVNCKRVGHLTRDCRSPAATNNHRNPTCYQCGNQGHYRSDCLELKNQDHGNQARGYVVDSDPEKDEKDPKEDLAYYPADRGKDDDDESSNDEENDDDVEKDEEDKEKEEHLAPADPSDVSTEDLVAFDHLRDILSVYYMTSTRIRAGNKEIRDVRDSGETRKVDGDEEASMGEDESMNAGVRDGKNNENVDDDDCVNEIIDEIRAGNKEIRDVRDSGETRKVDGDEEASMGVDESMYSSVKTVQGKSKFFYSFVYAANQGKERAELWKDLTIQKQNVQGKPWVLLGDFNVTLHAHEHFTGGSSVTHDNARVQRLCLHK
nr:reverse transcriptase domain-containing protein [Tanacetum cinerariifolium]